MAFLDDLYRDELGRAPDAEGRAYWQNALDTGTSQAQLKIDFDNAIEGLGFDKAAAQAQYQQDYGYLDSQQKQNQYDAGLNTVTAASGVQNSVNYSDDPFNDNAEFVNNVYLNELGRSSEGDAGAQFYIDGLESGGASRNDIIRAINDDSEGRGYDAYVAPRAAPAAAPAPDQVTAVGYTPEAAEAVTYEAPERTALTLTERMNAILADDSDYLKMARTDAAQGMNQRGLLNSSIAIGAGQAAAIDRAMPLASGDANAVNQASRDNQAYTNEAVKYGASSTNQFSLANKSALDVAASQFAAAKNNASITNASNNLKQAMHLQVLEIQAYNTDQERQAALDVMSVGIFNTAVNSGLYADTSEFDNDGVMTVDNTEVDQARIDNYWQVIGEVVPDAGRPVIDAAIDAATVDVV